MPTGTEHDAKVYKRRKEVLARLSENDEKMMQPGDLKVLLAIIDSQKGLIVTISKRLEASAAEMRSAAGIGW